MGHRKLSTTPKFFVIAITLKIRSYKKVPSNYVFNFIVIFAVKMKMKCLRDLQLDCQTLLPKK